MARRDRTEATAVDSTEATPTEEEAVTADTTIEAPVEATESASEVPVQAEAGDQAAAPAATEKKEIDLTGFIEAVGKSVTERDSSTGDLPEAAIAPVVAAYRAVDGIAGKNKAKTYLQDQMREAMNGMDIQLARSYMVLQDNLSAGSGAAAPRQPVDPTKNFVERVAGLKLSLALALKVKPENVADDAEAQADALYGEVYNQAEAYLAWSANEAEDKGDEPVDVPSFVKGAVKLAQGKSAKVGGRSGGSGGGTSSGDRHDIGEHIRQAFENVASGTFLTVAEIRKAESTEYTEGPPSAGAISNRLFPSGDAKCSLDFITPGTNDKGNRGATKN